MKKNILLRTNLIVCLIIVIGFLATAALSYRANYSSSLNNIQQVSNLTSEGIYYQMTTTFTKPINISLTMANDSLLKEFLSKEGSYLENESYIETIRDYLKAYQEKYHYDSVFLVSTTTGRYYTYKGLDRILTRDNPENKWYYSLLEMDDDYAMEVDNDEAANNEITVFVNCKIKDDSGNVMGIVGVGVRIDYLQQMLRNYQDEFNINAYLINHNGIIEISSEHTGYHPVNLFEVNKYENRVQKNILEWKEEGKATSFWAKTQTKEKELNFVVARYLPELEWHLVVERHTGVLVEKLNQQLAQTLLIICVIIVVILLVITYVIRSFNRQIITLTQSIEQERRTMFEQATEQLYENIYELDITRNRPANKATEQYFDSLGAPPGTPYDKALQIVAEKQIKEEFRQGYIDMFTPEHVMQAYEQGCDSLHYDFMISNGGDYYWMRITARIIKWESDGSIHMLTYRQNIDALKKQEYRMQLLIQLDEMTGLLTKTATRQRIEELLRKKPNQMYAFFILDIDVFKQANDRYGHAFGDAVIVSFTEIIKDHFRKDDIIGRIGGDEFVAFIPVPNEEWAVQKAGELAAALNWVYTEEDKSWMMSASIGVAFTPKDGRNYEELYGKADKALYETKKQGKNGYTIYGRETQSKKR